ncbi:MAG: recombinase family protein [Chloroflexota bacterium]
MARKYQKKKPPQNLELLRITYVTDKKVILYYRQSSPSQVGNTSTEVQLEDMVNYLIALGWRRDQIHIVDADKGISGQKKIKERSGMQEVYDLMLNDAFATVAMVHPDRGFRDTTMIEPNMFIARAVEKQVRIVTKLTGNYNFVHPEQGIMSQEIFRMYCKAAARFIETQIHGRLIEGQNRLAKRGKHVRGPVLFGFIKDQRRRLPDGSENPGYRDYLPHPQTSLIVRHYFELFRQFNGNVKKTFEYIDKHGPYIPEAREHLAPEGFSVGNTYKYRSEHTGQLMPSEGGLRSMLTNVHYIGHWIHKSSIERFYNHEGIVPEPLFMYAFNRLSRWDFHGDENPNHVPRRAYNRRSDDHREVPIYTAHIRTTDILTENGHPHPVGKHKRGEGYVYYIKKNGIHWSICADNVDQKIDALLLNQLQTIAQDDYVWKQALTESLSRDQQILSAIEFNIRQNQQIMQRIAHTIHLLDHDDLIKQSQARYRNLEVESVRLQAKHASLEAEIFDPQYLQSTQNALLYLCENWQRTTRAQREQIFELVGQRILLNWNVEISKTLEIYWHNDTITQVIVAHKRNSNRYTAAELVTLKRMIDNNEPQVDILREFPSRKWRTLLQTYSYHFVKGSRGKPDYTGDCPYPQRTCWTDTHEYQLERGNLM